MTAKHETSPYSGEPDAFDLIAGELLEFMEDPYLKAIHEEARLTEEIARTEGGDSQFVLEQLVAELDSKWRYTGEKIVVTGDFWIHDFENKSLVKHRLIGVTVTSRGFSFSSVTTRTEDNNLPKVGHYVELDRPDGDGRTSAVIALDDIDEFILPAPSAEAREARFAYNNQDAADWLDELNFTAKRGDQVVSDLGEFFIDINLSSADGPEMLKDAEQYMRRRAEIEKEANYKVTVVGDVIFADNNGYGGPGNLKETFTVSMHIRDIFLRPADMETETVEGEQHCVPFIDAVAFLATGEDQRMLIPCSSIHTIHSVRYDSAP